MTLPAWLFDELDRRVPDDDELEARCRAWGRLLVDSDPPDLRRYHAVRRRYATHGWRDGSGGRHIGYWTARGEDHPGVELDAGERLRMLRETGYLTVEDVATELGVSVPMVHGMRRRGAIVPTVDADAKSLYTRPDVEAREMER